MDRSREDILIEYRVLRAQEGHRGAFEALYRRCGPGLARYARRLMGSADGAADPLQEAWVEIARKIRRVRDPARFRAWSYRIVRGKCADAARRASTRRRHESASVARGGPAPEPGAAEERREALDAGLARLDADAQMLLAMHHVDGMPIRAIAAALGTPEGTVKTRLARARRELRGALEEVTA